MRILIRNGTLVTLGDPCRVLEGTALLLDGETIARLAPADEIPGPFDREIDARGKVVLPGFVNAHTHFYAAFARGLGRAAPAATFLEVLENLWWRLDRALTPDDVEASARVVLLEAVRNGTTTLLDHHASPRAVPGSLERIARAVKETGLRACLSYEVSDRDGPEVAEKGLAENAAFARACTAARDPQLRALVGLHAAFTLSDETLAKAARLSDALGVGCHVHVAEAASDVAANLARHGKTPAARLADHGVLRRGSVAAHAVHVDARDRDLLAASGARVVHNAQSNLNNAVGIADLPALAAAGVPVGLGTDGMGARMLEEVRTAVFAQRLSRGDPRGGFSEATRALFAGNPRIASEIWGFPIGTLAEGAAADVVLVDYVPPTPFGDENVLAHLVFGVSQAAVDTTICGGRILMEGRRLSNGVDEEALLARSRRLAAALWERF